MIRTRALPSVLAICIALALNACGGSIGTAPIPPSVSPPPLPSASNAPQFVGYWDDWEQTPWSQVPAGVTTLIIAFDFVNGHTVIPDGASPGYVTPSAIAALHQRGIKVLISLGGASPASAFTFDGDTADFETSLLDESGTQAQRTTLLETLIPATRAAFNAYGMVNGIITLAAYDSPDAFGDGAVLATPGVATALSWVNVMSYDYTLAETDLQLFAALYPTTHLMLGSDTAGDVPNPSSATLSTLASWVKTNTYGGMMVWTLNATTQAQSQAITTALQ